MGKREPILDVSRVLASMVDITIARVFEHDTVKEFSVHSKVRHRLAVDSWFDWPETTRSLTQWLPLSSNL